MTAPILVAGGGIGGLAAALELAGQGFDVAVYEVAPQLGEIGAGIQLSPNCTRVLFDAGLEDALRAVAFVPEGGEMRAWDTGEVLTATPLGEAALREFGFPYFHIHRADLIDALAAGVAAHGRIELHTGADVEGFDQDGDGVSLRIAGAENQVRGAALVGADGIRSAVRAGLFGPDEPRFTNMIAWRALVPTERLPDGLIRPMATAWWGPGMHFVHYYLRRGELVNCVCVVEKSGWEVESWTERGEYEELKADVAGWHDDIQTLVDQADRDALFKWALFDRLPMTRWGKGRATLLGDACHATLPFMAQGAAMAIEDGAVLARCLRERIDAGGDERGAIETGLDRYAELRMQRTARVQAGSRRNATLFHLSGAKAWARNAALKNTPERLRPNPQEWIFRYDALGAHETHQGS